MNAISAMKKTKQQLHEAGFKLTPQREATLLVLLENEKEHLSAEEIFFLVKKKSPEIGLATCIHLLIAKLFHHYKTANFKKKRTIQKAYCSFFSSVSHT